MRLVVPEVTDKAVTGRGLSEHTSGTPVSCDDAADAAAAEVFHLGTVSGQRVLSHPEGTIAIMSAITALGIHAPAPDAGELVAALVSVTGGPDPVWCPAVVAGSGARGQVCELQVGAAVVRVFEAPLPAAMPEALTVTVDDLGGAVARLRTAGFTVLEAPGLPATAVITAGGVSIRIRLALPA